ncbi:NADH-cytochrome b-5 reductase [Phlyctema vagabunda]|uniref:NADH-cytochrome b-5 reductase n=1 Tax=Phlyctema vagabunda TaxID=108571 RepID=A0ABR4P8B5_9HELO
MISLSYQARKFTYILQSFRTLRRMGATKASLSHLERTAEEPRDDSLHRVKIDKIEQVNETFLPGQWLDVHVPDLPKPGGFTITSPPSLAKRPTSSIELAIQASSSNPAAAYLWRSEADILGSELAIRVGGSFTWPPTFYGKEIERVVFVAGGVGINPLMAMLSHISEVYEKVPFEIMVLYSFKYSQRPVQVEEILFLRRLWGLDKRFSGEWLRLFVTGNSEQGLIKDKQKVMSFESRRMAVDDVLKALGPIEARQNIVCYVCGVPNMTDQLVDVLKNAEGMDKRHVICERWW